MPIIRNPFRKQDENARPVSQAKPLDNNNAATHPVDVQQKSPAEYKLSEINDSGVYLPPSPTERKTFWTTSSRSTTSSNIRSTIDENAPFNISRESFDSYRRSFDISARSPVMQPNESRPRASLDSRTFQPPPRMSLDVRPPHPPPSRSSSSFLRPCPEPEVHEQTDQFEEVEFDDAKPPKTKRRGFFRTDN